MNYRKLKSQLKPIVLMIAPKFYYKRMAKQMIRQMKISNPYVATSLSVSYDPAGKYPTMYDKPPAFYKDMKNRMLFDEDKIPYLYINNRKVYHPVHLIQFALSEYGFYLATQEASHLEAAKNICDWLVENQDINNGCWYYTYDYLHVYTNYTLRAPWASAMAQGQAISLLTRMYRVTKEEKYLVASLNATKILDIPISSGGLASELWGYTIFEEYPTIPCSLTLNGFMFCTLGLYDLSKLTEDQYVMKLWIKSKEAMFFMVPLYDGDIMSTYCLSHITMGNTKRSFADPYHSIHITMLQCFESFMPNSTFEFYIKRWAGFWGIKIDE